MKQSGIIRKIDAEGRVVIPREFRKLLKMENTVDKFEIFLENDRIILKKHAPCCTFCGSSELTTEFEEHTVCYKCIEKLEAIRREEQPFFPQSSEQSGL